MTDDVDSRLLPPYNWIRLKLRNERHFNFLRTLPWEMLGLLIFYQVSYVVSPLIRCHY